MGPHFCNRYSTHTSGGLRCLPLGKSFFFLSLESVCGGHSQPLCWKHISRDGQSPMRAYHSPQGCRTLIFSLKVSPDDEIVLLANTKCDFILVLPNRSSSVCSGPFAFSLPPPQHLTDITTLPWRPQWVSNYCVIDATMSKCALGKRNFAKTDTNKLNLSFLLTGCFHTCAIWLSRSTHN